MKASELRTNNYISHNWIDRNGNAQNIITVFAICDNWISVNSNRLPDYETIMESDIKPIPLTEEWLLKFGFGYLLISVLQKTILK